MLQLSKGIKKLKENDFVTVVFPEKMIDALIIEEKRGEAGDVVSVCSWVGGDVECTVGVLQCSATPPSRNDEQHLRSI